MKGLWETRCFWPGISVQRGALRTQMGNGVLGRAGRGRPCPERLPGTGRSAGEDSSVFTLCCCPGSPASERHEYSHPLPATNVSGTTEMTLAAPVTGPGDVASNRGQGGRSSCPTSAGAACSRGLAGALLGAVCVRGFCHCGRLGECDTPCLGHVIP